ncbi:MAG: methyltransferase type 11 [uncultured bacterium (gcode 4)]|uniref:Methyltransferase type 11 n=1 Tax=uncultured bacterium (gcode 4) TaxID=1234023 RepID=K2BBQ8_9BACT|nr:MAG: methyltransferase type 11 [uncultured bacterium (gcode 4)]
MRNFSFEKNSSTFFDKLIAKLRYKKVFNLLKKHWINLNWKTICDIGCWYNANLLNYLKENYSDLSLYWVDLDINKKLSYINFVKANIEKDILNIKNESIDILFTLAVIEHLSNPKLYLLEIKRILKPWWILVMTTPSIYWKPILEFLAYSWIWTKEEILDHKIYYNKNSLKYLVLKYFEDINIKYFQFWLNIILLAKKTNYDK